MEVVAEAQVDNEMKVVHQRANLLEDKPSPPQCYSSSFFSISTDYSPDIDIVLSEDAYPWMKELFCLLPHLNIGPRSLWRMMHCPLNDFAAEHPLDHPDPPPDPLDQQKMDMTNHLTLNSTSLSSVPATPVSYGAAVHSTRSPINMNPYMSVPTAPVSHGATGTLKHC